MSEKNPIIEAKTIEDFQSISAALKTLPEQVYEQILSAKLSFNGIIDCTLAYNFKTDIVLVFPKETTQIRNFGDFIGVYYGDFIFRIVGDMYKNCKISYLFI